MLRRVTQNFAAQALSLVVSFADRFLVVGILLRVWGPQVYADWVLLLSCAGLLSLGELGLNIYYGNVLQKAHVNNDPGRFQRMVSVALACSLALGGLLGAVALLVLLSVDLPGFLSVSALSRGEAIVGLFLLGLATLSRIVRGGISPIYRGRQAFARGIVIDLGFLGSLVVVSVAAGLMGAAPVLLAVFYLACDLLAGWGLMLWDMSRRWPEISFRPQLPTRAELGDMAHQMRWFAVLHIASTAWVSLPVVLLGYLGLTGVALVSFLLLRIMANLGRQLAAMLAMSSGVEIAGVHHAGRSDDAARQLAAVGRVLASITAAMAVAVALFGEPFVALWTGQSTLFDKSTAAALFAAVLVSAPTLPLLMFEIFSNAPKPVAIASLTQLALGLAGCALLAVPYGVPGAAMGLFIGEAIGQGIVLPAMASRHAGLDYWRYLGQCLGVMALTALWCGAVGLTVRLVIDPHGLAGLLASGVLWGVIGLVPALAAVMPAAHRAWIAQRVWGSVHATAALLKSRAT